VKRFSSSTPEGDALFFLPLFLLPFKYQTHKDHDKFKKNIQSGQDTYLKSRCLYPWNTVLVHRSHWTHASYLILKTKADMEDIQKRIEDLVGGKVSGWLKEAQWRQENRAWLNHSFEIALQSSHGSAGTR
jgi:hypothetical protein